MSAAIFILTLMACLFMTSIKAFSPRSPGAAGMCYLSCSSQRKTSQTLCNTHHFALPVLHHRGVCHSFFHQSSLTSPISSDPRGITSTVLSSIADCSSSDYAHDGPDDSSIFDTLTISLQRLKLTPEQTITVLTRVRLSFKTMNAKQKNEILNFDSTLSWLEDPDQLGLSKESLRTIIVGYPPLVGMSLETNIIPTITFLDKALNGDGTRTSSARSLHEIQKSQNSSAVESLLCEMPSILEYNVGKRLAPRLERVRSFLNITSVNEDVIRTIATKTDSRFEEWLANERSDEKKQGINAANWKTGDPRHRTTDIENRPRRHGEPLAYVIVSNLQSGSNIGNIVRSASIFGCEECLVVGKKRYRMTGDHGARFDLPRRHVYTHADARDYLLQNENDQDGDPSNSRIRIYGVEIMANASPIMRYDHETGIMHFPFHRQWKGAAFIFGNEGQGLSEKQREICDEFLFIPQTRGGSRIDGGSSSMNVACAATVILQAYCTWAGYSDAPLEGEKFLAQSS